MDVGNPSNLERLIHLGGPDAAPLRGRIRSLSVSDEQIREIIRQGTGRYGEIWCPHTAAAVYGREQQNSPHWIIVSTAHPAKFADVVEPLIGHAVAVPPQLQALLSRPSHCLEIEARLEDLRYALGHALTALDHLLKRPRANVQSTRRKSRNAMSKYAPESKRLMTMLSSQAEIT